MSREATETFAEIRTPDNPFPGLRPFEFDESHLFFGRDGQSEQLIGKLGRSRFLAVVGTSGSGKSSLVRAGLLPTLLGGFMTSAGSDWRIAIMRPGNNPIGNLAGALNAPDVFGSDIKENAAIQTAIAEAALRRSSLGLVDAIRQAAMPTNENLLVLVDQFEEIFRFARVSEGARFHNDAAAFVKLILEASSQRDIPIYVVLTMRSDYLGDCSQFWDLPEAINESQYLIPRLTRDQLREAIIGPVAVGGGSITPRLVNRLLNDVGDSQDQLPVLQHLLMRAWDECKEKRFEVESQSGDLRARSPHKNVHEGEAMDLCCSEAVGGIAQALSRHADEAFNELPDDRHRAVSEKIFKALTEKGADNREIRRPIMMGELCAVAAATQAEATVVIDKFRQSGTSFLMPPADVELNPQALIDISHESLIRGWGRLKNWVEEEARSARIYRRLADTAVLHRAGEEALLIDPALQMGLDWRDQNRPNADWARRYHPEFETAMAFLDQSAAARDAETREREEQQRKEARYKRTRVVALLLGLSFLLSLASTVYAFRQRAAAVRLLEFANMQTDLAEQKTEEALEQRKEAERLGELAELRQREASFRQQEAEEQRAKAEEQAALARKNAELASAQRAIALREKARADAAALKNRQLLYPADINLAQQAYESGNIERMSDLLETHASAQDSSDDLRGFEWYYLRHLLDSVPHTLKPPEKGLILTITSPDGETLATGAGRKVELRRVGGGEAKYITLPDEFSSVGSLAISPDGKMLAVGDSQGAGEESVIVYDTESSKKLGSLKAGSFGKNSDSANCVTFTPNGKKLIVGGGSGTVALWDVNSSREPDIIPLEGTINLAVSPDGKMLAIGSRDSENKTFPVSLWKISEEKKEKLVEMVGHGGPITGAAFTPDGKSLATSSSDKTVRLWDVESRQPLSVLSFTSGAFSLAFSPDGHFLAIGYEDGLIKLCGVENASQRNQVCASLRGHHQAVTSLSFSADGKLLFSSDNKRSDPESLTFEASDNTGIKSWDIGKLIPELTPVHTVRGPIAQMTYSPDGKILAATAVGDVNGFLLNSETNERLGTIFDFQVDQKLALASVAFSPDGKLFAAVQEGSTVRIWNASTRKPFSEAFGIADASIRMAVSSDGKSLAALDGSKLKVWNTDSMKLESEQKEVEDFVFLPDNKSIAIFRHSVLQEGEVRRVESAPSTRVEGNGAIELWDRGLKRRLRKIQLPPPPETERLNFAPTQNLLSPNGRLLAVNYQDGNIMLFDTGTGQELATLRCEAEAVPYFTFSPDGRILLTGGLEGTVKLWDMASYRESLTLRGEPYYIMSAAFSPDGKRLATVDAANHLRVWHAPRNVSDKATRSKER